MEALITQNLLNFLLTADTFLCQDYISKEYEYVRGRLAALALAASLE